MNFSKTLLHTPMSYTSLVLFKFNRVNSACVFITFCRSQFIHLWNIDSQHLIRIIQLQSKIKDVKGVAFVNDSFSADKPQVLLFIS